MLVKARKPLLITFGALLALAVVVGVTAETLEERLAPIGKLCMAGEPCAAPAARIDANAEPRSGEVVYTTSCYSCHATGAAGAPKLGAADWGNRLAVRGLEALYTNAIEGYNAMPAKGLCLDCTDAEIKAAVDYILAES